MSDHSTETKLLASSVLALLDASVQSKKWNELCDLLQPQPQPEQLCEWKRESVGDWITDCKKFHEFPNNYPPHWNEFTYCPFCGRKIKEIK